MTSPPGGAGVVGLRRVDARVIVHPLLLGGGRALFAGVESRRALTLGAEPASGGRVVLSYRV